MRAASLAAIILTACSSAAAVPLAAQEDRDQSVAGGGVIPAGWSARTDHAGDLKNAKITTTGDGLGLTLGPATILWRAEDRVGGPFHTVATFTQNQAPRHSEGYGLFVGGKGLQGSQQKYIYFLVRGDGTYLIKRRAGEQTTEIKPWTPSAAVHKAGAKGKATNLLEIDAKRDSSRVVFKVNGQEVYASDARSMELDGLVGIRANHNLDLTVSGFGVHR